LGCNFLEVQVRPDGIFQFSQTFLPRYRTTSSL
jgi:hypothetical protein